MYHLLYEDAQKAVVLPGSREPFLLCRYQQELGKEFKCISFYLCSNHDFLVAADVSDDEEHEYIPKCDVESPPKKQPKQASPATSCVDLTDDQIEKDKESQIEHDEKLAKMLQET